MQGWQIAYHLVFLLLVTIAVVGILRRRGPDIGLTILWVPVVMATLAEFALNAIWSPELGSSSTAGVGILIAWMINAGFGVMIALAAVTAIRRP